METKWTFIAFGVVFVIWIGWIISVFSALPETIPMHFNAVGEVDGWGKRSMVWALPAIALFSVMMMLSVPYFNQKYINYPVKITEENRKKQHQLMILFIRLLAAVIMGMMIYISFVSIHLALGNPAPHMVYIWLFMGGVFDLMIWYMIKARRLR